MRKYEENLAKYGGNEEKAISNSKETDQWPPPEINAKTLFNFFYAHDIRQAYEAKHDKNKHKTD